MDIPPEVIAAKEELEGPLIESGLITGLDFGMSDESQRDPEDVALRIFVTDSTSIPPEVEAALEFFPFPVVVIQRVFDFAQTTLPDTTRHRPVEGGVSVAASRFASTGTAHAGTLGAIVTDAADPDVRYGLSNFHVLCIDANRQVGDEIVQPEPSPFGSLPGDRIGTLENWDFPETTQDGLIDAAICLLEESSMGTVADIGAVFGTVAATLGKQVTKRGRTTGQTFGFISGIGGSYPMNYPRLPPVTTVGGVTTTVRSMKNQIQVAVDFPTSIVFSDQGDSGSVVVDGNGQVVGLHWGSASNTPGDPRTHGVASPADTVEALLGIRF